MACKYRPSPSLREIMRWGLAEGLVFTITTQTLKAECAWRPHKHRICSRYLPDNVEVPCVFDGGVFLRDDIEPINRAIFARVVNPRSIAAPEKCAFATRSMSRSQGDIREWRKCMPCYRPDSCPSTQPCQRSNPADACPPV